MINCEIGDRKMICSELFDSQYFNKSRLITDPDNLNVNIRWLYLAELADSMEEIEANVRPGDAIITTGKILCNGVITVEQLLRMCVKCSISALILYENECTDNILEFVDFANTNRLSIILLTKDSETISDVFSDITYMIAHENRDYVYAYYGLMDLIIQPDKVNNETIINRARQSKIDLTLPHRGLVIVWDDSVDNAKNNHGMIAKISNICEDVLYRYYDRIFMAPYENYFAVLLPDNKYGITVNTLAENLQEKLNEEFPYKKFRIGIGNKYDEITDFKKSIEEAYKILSFGTAMKKEDKVLNINDMLSSMFLYSQLDNQYLAQIIEKNLRPLIIYDESEKADLHKTLRTYLANDKNIGITANELYIHRNTLTNRLSKIEEILDSVDLNDPDDCFEINIALFAYKIYSIIHE